MSPIVPTNADLSDIAERVEDLIIEWATGNLELGWPGSGEVIQHAHELAGYLSDNNVLKEGA